MSGDQVKALFGIDPEGPEDVFTGWHIPWNRWNGWATPAFERSEIERILAWLARTNAGHDEADTFAWDGDVLLRTSTDGDDVFIERIEADRDGRYGLGAFSWTWSEVDSEEFPTTEQ
jgi:hypothetical protein